MGKNSSCAATDAEFVERKNILDYKAGSKNYGRASLGPTDFRTNCVLGPSEALPKIIFVSKRISDPNFLDPV